MNNKNVFILWKDSMQSHVSYFYGLQSCLLLDFEVAQATQAGEI